MHQQRAARVVHVLAYADVHLRQGLDDVEESPDVHLHAERSQQPTEDEHVADQGVHGEQSPRHGAGDEADQSLSLHRVDVVPET